MNKILLLGALIPILVLTQHAMAQLDPSQGYNDGVNQARADAAAGGQMSASCTDHGITNIGNEAYCTNYKAGYLVEQGALAISH